MKSKRILVVFDGLDFGGIERVGINYLKIFNEMKYQVTILNLIPNKNSMVSEIPENFKYISRKFTRFDVIETYDQKFQNNFFWLVTRLFIAIFLNIKMSLLKKIEGDYDIAIAFSGHFNDLKIINSKKVKTDKKIAWLHGSLSKYSLMSDKYSFYYKKIKNLVCLSDINDDNKATSVYNIMKIYNPIDINKKKTNDLLIKQLSEDYEDYLLMVARFTKEKDHVTVLKALNTLKQKYKLKKNLVLVGSGETLDSIKKLAKDLKISDQVKFIGARSDVENYYKSAYLFVHASPAEGLPTVIIEAMFNGLPVVTTKSMPGVLEIIPNDEYGIVCELNDYECLAKNIYELYEDNDKYNFYQNKSLERSNDFTFSNSKEKIKQLISNLE